MTEFLVATWQVISENPSLWNSFLHSFDVFKTWDFWPFKIILILLLIGLPILLIILIATWKLVLFNTMFWEWYWLKLITWTFGAWKTKNVFQSAYLWKMLNPDWIIISNLDYDFVDIVFDSKEDFDFVLKDLVQYVRDTNNIDELKSSINFPPIKIIVDEAHIYLFARDFKWFTKDILLVLTQCRKRDISIDFITQELWQIDVFIRRLAPYIQYFQTLSFGLRKQSMLYSLDAEATSMRDELSFEEVDSSYLLPDSWALFFKKKLQRFYDQKYLTKYVIWWLHKYCNEEDRESIKELKISHRYEEFKKILSDKVKSFRTPKVREKTKFEKILFSYLEKLNKKNETDSDVLQRQSEIIKSLLKYVPEDELDKFNLDIQKQEDSSKESETTQG